MTLLQANHLPAPVEQHRRVCTAGRKESLEPESGAQRRTSGRMDERSSETEIARQAYALLRGVPLFPGKDYGNFQPIALVFPRYHNIYSLLPFSH